MRIVLVIRLTRANSSQFPNTVFSDPSSFNPGNKTGGKVLYVWFTADVTPSSCWISGMVALSKLVLVKYFEGRSKISPATPQSFLISLARASGMLFSTYCHISDSTL